MQKEARRILLNAKASDRRCTWQMVANAFGISSAAAAWQYAHGKRKIPKDVLNRMNIKPRPRVKPVNWYKRFKDAERILNSCGYTFENGRWVYHDAE